MESTGKDAAKMFEMTAKGLEYYINLVDKAVYPFFEFCFEFVLNLFCFLKFVLNFPILKEVLLLVKCAKQHCRLQRNCS